MTPRVPERALVCAAAIAAGVGALWSPLAGCGGGSSAAGPADASRVEAGALSSDALRDPRSCASCHADHYAQWASSVHAHASSDPLFVAMNRRFQRETSGAQPTFCTQCHAPMAAREDAGATTDTAALSPAQSGVTCFFCHSTTSVNGVADDPLALATDGALRADIGDPVPTSAHASTYSALHDGTSVASSAMCGACHDVTFGPSGIPIERTFAEWKTSLYAQNSAQTLQTCASCHMPAYAGTAASPPNAVPARKVHDHSVPGVDLAPGADDTSAPDGGQAALIQASLDSAIGAQLCVGQSDAGGGVVTVTLDNGFVGHAWPSGAVHDRRAWVELVAASGGSTVFTSGVVPSDQTSVESIGDPNLWLLKESLAGADGGPVLFMWQAASAQPSLLPPVTTNSPGVTGQNAVSRTYAVPAGVDDVKMRVRLLPVAVEVVQALIASGDLDPSYLASTRAWTLSSTVLEWSLAASGGSGCVP